MALVRKSQKISDLTRITSDETTLLVQLRDPQPDQRRLAALDLATQPRRTEAIAALGAQVAVETDPSAREAMLTAMLGYGGREVVEVLIPLLRSEDASLRNEVIEVLQQFTDEVAPFIEVMLQDEDPDYRIFSINVISHLNHPHAPQWLHSVICNDPHVNVCCAAIEGLAEVGTPDMVAALEALPTRFNDDPFVTFGVQMAIARICSDAG